MKDPCFDPVSQLQEADLGKRYCFASILSFASVFSGNRKIRVSSWLCASRRIYLAPIDGKQTKDIPALSLRIFLSTLFFSMEMPFEKEVHPGLQEMLPN